MMWQVHMEQFNLGSFALHVFIFPSVFCQYVSKISFSRNLYYFSKWHKTEMHFWCDLSCDVSYSFCRAETVHDNHQCYHCRNLMHIDVIYQYCIILEMIICRSVETLFVSSFHDTFFLSVSMTVDEKHFLSNL